MNHSRRRFFTRGAGFAAAACLLPRMGFAADVPRVDEANPQATALGYKHDASEVDTAKFTRYEPGQTCANCQLYTGAADSEWGPCGLFAGQHVAAAGWCSAWVPKA